MRLAEWFMRFFRSTAALFLFFAAGLGRSQGPVQAVLPGETKEYLSRLKLADDLAARQKWSEVVDEYQHLLRDGGDVLVPTENGRSVQLRRLCQERLAALPPRGLEVYRRRVEVQTRRWLERGTAERDTELLRRIVDDAFCSRAGEKALDLLGDLAFERGEFAEARQWWHLLAPLPSEAGRLHFPDPQGDTARVHAKQILALLFEGEQTAAESEWKRFAKSHAKAAGNLAGQDGNYVGILHHWLKRPPDFPELQEWPTFAGSAARQRDLPTKLPSRLWAAGPTWRVSLNKPEHRSEGEQPAVSAALARRLAFHPIIVEDRVLVADARRVLSFDLMTGRLRFHYDLGKDDGQANIPEQKRPAEPDARYTLTAAEGRVYACLGATSPEAAKKSDSFLVCLDLRDAGKKRNRQRWLIRAKGKAGEMAFFEGTPIVRQRRVYVIKSGAASARRFRAALACYDAETGVLRWERPLCEVAAAPGVRSHLLTLAGGLLVYCSDAGVIVAVDAETGKLAWGVRYPKRQAADERPSPRDLAPPVYAAGRLFIAPADSDRLLCLDPYSGRVLWERNGIEPVHLLGCSRGRLLFTTPAGLRAVGTRTGADTDGWIQPEEGKLPGFGRGLLAGGWVFWPVQDAKLPLRALSVEDNDLIEPAQLRLLRPGNMAYGQGCVVVAGVGELVGYVPSAGNEGIGEPQKTVAPGLGTKPVQRPAHRAPASREEIGTLPALPLQRAWKTASSRLLPASYNATVPGNARVIFSADADGLHCREPKSGAERWTCRLPFKPSWLGCHADMVLAADAHAVHSLRLADGRPVWSWKAGDSRFSEYRLTNSHLFYLLSCRRLVALDLDGGFVDWSCWAPSARLFPIGGGRFQPSYYAGDRWIILQTTGGHRLVLDSRTGREVNRAAAAIEPWPQPPLPLSGNRFVLVENARRVLLLDAARAKEFWSWKPRLPTALTGEPPRLFGDEMGLFLLVARNLGYDLERLDPRTGVSQWPEAFRLIGRPVDAEAVAHDDKAVYVAWDDMLLARSLEDGKLLWKQKLSESAPRWQVRRLGAWLVLWPKERDWLRWSWLPAGEFAVAVPLRARLGWPFPVLLYQAADGKLVQRLDFKTTVPEGKVQFFPGRLVVSVPGTAWGLEGAQR
jgi:outer membrane protein assembly factor BamB